MQGSSPHTRGRLKISTMILSSPGFIPAHAGQVQNLANIFVRHYLGSSPHTRGRFKNTGDPVPILRFIPAHAGQVLHKMA